jgi:hypothetical protein
MGKARVYEDRVLQKILAENFLVGVLCGIAGTIAIYAIAVTLGFIV